MAAMKTARKEFFEVVGRNVSSQTIKDPDIFLKRVEMQKVPGMFLKRGVKIQEDSGLYKEADKAHEVHSIHPESEII